MTVENSTVEWTVGAIRRQSNLFEDILTVGMMQQFFEKTLNMSTGYQFRKVVDLLDYYYMPDYLRVEQYLRKETERDPAFLERLIPLTYEAGEYLLDLGARIQQRDDLKNLSVQELNELFVDYIEAALSTVPMAYAAFPIEQILEEAIREQLKKDIERIQTERDIDEFFHAFISHDIAQSDYALVAERDLLELAARIQEDEKLQQATINAESIADSPDEVLQAVSRHSAQYGWINTDGYLGNPWEPEDIFTRVQRWLKFDCRSRLEDMDARREKLKQEYYEALDELNASETLRKLVSLAHQYIQLRPYRPMVLIKAGYQVRNLLSDIAHRFSMTYEDIIHFTHTEISGLLNGSFHIDPKNLAKRKERRGYIVIDGRTQWFFGDDVALIEDNEEVEQDYSRVREIIGRVATKGVAIGRARLLVDLLDLPPVEDGDIIVASMTMPDMLPAMERAGAYVTDEGGITCHAAIVSRELNVPCIIGTEIATSVIKDGDLLEVNANIGKVTILTRNK